MPNTMLVDGSVNGFGSSRSTLVAGGLHASGACKFHRTHAAVTDAQPGVCFLQAYQPASGS
jgi:hypothetical protein